MALHPKAVFFMRMCIQFSSVALLYYDYVLTLPSEIRLIWQRKLSWTSILYCLCRYALVANLIYLLALAKLLNGVHVERWYLFITCTSIAGRAAVLGIWTARTWALWERKHWVLGILLPILLAVVGLDILSATNAGTIAIDRALSILVVVHEWTSAGLAVYRCLETMKFNRALILLPGTSAYKELLQQGVLYIVAVSSFTLAAVVLNFVAPQQFMQRLLNAFTLPVSGLFTARFILHMRRITSQEKTASFLHSDPVVSRPIAFDAGTRHRSESDESTLG